MSDMFDIDMSRLSVLGSCRLNEKSATMHLVKRNTQAVNQEIASNIENASISKFCRACIQVNIDPMHPKSLQVMLLLCSKTPNCFEVARSFGAQQEPPIQIDHVDNLEYLHQIISSNTDWYVLLNRISLPRQFTDTFSNEVVRALAYALDVSKLTIPFDTRSEFITNALIYINIRGTTAQCMLAKLVKRMDSAYDTSSGEEKCMRMLNFYHDRNLSNQELESVLLQCVQHVIVDNTLFQSISKVLLANKQNEHNSKKNRPHRPSLRRIALEIHKNISSDQNRTNSTFQAWAVEMKFNLTTSTQLQRLLYFIRVQTIDMSDTLVAHIFNEDILQRTKQSKIDNIDVDAICTVINSLRVYHQNIYCLLDFRSRCMSGLNITTRQRLAPAEVAQLYISFFQHDSIWQQCWKSIVPVMNHTITSARTAFIATNRFEIEAVIKSLIVCHVGGNGNA